MLIFMLLSALNKVQDFYSDLCPHRSSTVFDFGMRYKLKEAVKHDDFSLLMDEWMGPMLWYDREQAVTFTDNHDTAGDHHFAISDHFGSTHQIAAGYVMILTHPSRPCIFWQDWMGPNRDAITQLLAIRHANDIGPSSSWQLVHGQKGLYAAIIGDRVAMKLGMDWWDPNNGLPSMEWQLAAAGDVTDVAHLPPVDQRIVPPGQLLLLDESFDSWSHDGNTIKARITAFCAPPVEGEEASDVTDVTIRVFAAHPSWPWPATNDTNKFKLREKLLMHWAAAHGSSAEWGRPGDEMLPPFHDNHRDGDCVQTFFGPAISYDEESDGWEQLQPHVREVRLAVPANVKALNFVMKHHARGDNEEDRWYKTDGNMHRPPSNFHIRPPKDYAGSSYWAVWQRIPPQPF